MSSTSPRGIPQVPLVVWSGRRRSRCWAVAILRHEKLITFCITDSAATEHRERGCRDFTRYLGFDSATDRDICVNNGSNSCPLTRLFPRTRQSDNKQSPFVSTRLSTSRLRVTAATSSSASTTAATSSSASTTSKTSTTALYPPFWRHQPASRPSETNWREKGKECGSSMCFVCERSHESQ